MAADEWTFPISKATTGQGGTLAKEIQFGEGIRQIGKMGGTGLPVTINIVVQAKDFANLQAVWDFIEAKDGTSFLWTYGGPNYPSAAPMSAVQKSWTAHDPRWEHNGGEVSGLSCTFRRFFVPT